MRKKLKWLTGFAFISIVFFAFLGAKPTQAVVVVQGQTTVVINGEQQSYGLDVENKNGTVFVPLRGVFEELGAQVNWNGKNQSIQIKRKNTTITMKVGSKQAKVNQTNIYLPRPAHFNKKGSVIVPIRFISEALGEEVYWENATTTVHIGKKPQFNKIVGALPKGAHLIEDLIGSRTYSYTKTLSSKNRISRVHLSMPYFPQNNKMLVTVFLYDQKGSFFIVKQLEGESVYYSWPGNFEKPDFEISDYYESGELISEFFRAYGK